MPSAPREFDSFKPFIVKMTALQSTGSIHLRHKLNHLYSCLKFMFSCDFTKTCLPVFVKKVLYYSILSFSLLLLIGFGWTYR